MCVLIVGAALFSVLYSAQFIRFFSVFAVAICGIMLVFAIRKRSAPGAVLALIGVVTVLASSIMSTDLNLTEENIKPHLFWWDQPPQKLRALELFPTWGKLWSLATGAFCIVLGMLLAYRPSMMSIRNRLPFEYPYPVWQSRLQAIKSPGANLIR